MKFILSLIPIQILAILDRYIVFYLTKWVNTHYESRPLILYHVIVYIVFGICISAITTQWRNVSNRIKWVTLFCGIANVCAVCVSFIYPYQIPVLTLLLVGFYAYLGLAQLKQK